MPVVNKDATSGKWWPSASGQWPSLLGGRLTSLPSPSMAYGCQDAATPLVDDFGGDNMAAASTSFQQPVSGWTRKGWQVADGTTSAAFTSNTYGGASQSTMQLAMFDIATPAITRTLQFGNNTQVDVNAAGKLIVSAAAAGPITTAGVYGGVGVFPLVVRANITAAFNRLNTNAEQIALATATNGNGHLFYGGVSAQSALTQYVGIAHWLGANAEYTDAMVAMLIDAINNGPAVSSIAVTPGTPTLAGVGSTQQLTATCTRFDTSTYDGTATVTWTSSAPSVATVSSSGLVTAVGAGTATITATFTSLGASAASGTSSITVSGVVIQSTVPAPNSLLAFLRFDEPMATLNPSDAIGSLNDLTPIGVPAVVPAFCGFGRQLGNNLGFTTTDVLSGATLTTRDVTVQTILSWDATTQATLGTNGTIVCRGLANSSAEYVAYAAQLRVVNLSLGIGAISLWWQDTAGTVYVEPEGQFLLPPTGQFMMLTAVRHWIDATHVEVRYYAGDQLLAEFATSDGNIGGGTTGTFCVGQHYISGSPSTFLAGIIDELRVLNYEVTAEEIAATWARISKLQPRAYTAVKQLMQPGAPVSNDPASRFQKLLRIVGHAFGYAAAQAENMRQNMLPDRAYGPVLAQHEHITGEAPLIVDSVQKRRKRVLSHVRQKNGVSIPGVAATVADLLAIGKTQVQILAFDNTIKDDFSLGLRPTLWQADDPAQWAVSSGALHVTAPNAANLAYDSRTWYTCLAAALGSRVSADGRPTAANDTTNYFNGRGGHILAKMSPTTLGAGGEAGIVFYDFAKNNVLCLGLRNTAGVYQIVTENFINGVSGGVTVQATSSLTTHWLHLFQNAKGGWAAGNRFYTPAFSTTGPTSGYTVLPDIQHIASFDWMGMYLRTPVGSTLGAATDVAFDDVIMRHQYGSRPFRFYVYRDPTLPGTPDIAGAELAVQRLQQSHTIGHVITTKVALTDTAGACDRVPMGGF